MAERAPAPERLLVTPAVREALFTHAREGAESDDGPAEVCGVLGGDADATPAPGAEATSQTAGDGPVARVETIEQVPNVADDPRYRYALDPQATLDAIDTIETSDGDHLGFYHSHPEGPRGPSRTDEARATWPGYVYLIVSLGAEPTVGAWRWTGERFVQLPVGVAGGRSPEPEGGAEQDE